VGDATLYPVVASALIVVGSFMLRAVGRINFGDPPAALVAFLTVVTMPFAFSITDGIAAGSTAYAFLMFAAGRGGAVHPLLYVSAGLLFLRYVFLV
jgi:adenine/guanine/hypoxanthine permease